MSSAKISVRSLSFRSRSSGEVVLGVCAGAAGDGCSSGSGKTGAGGSAAAGCVRERLCISRARRSASFTVRASGILLGIVSRLSSKYVLKQTAFPQQRQKVQQLQDPACIVYFFLSGFAEQRAQRRKQPCGIVFYVDLRKQRRSTHDRGQHGIRVLHWRCGCRQKRLQRVYGV